MSKKTYVAPAATVMELATEDIVVTSPGQGGGFVGGEDIL